MTKLKRPATRIAYLEARLEVALAERDEARRKVEYLEEEARIKAATERAMARRRSYGDGPWRMK